MKQQYRHIDRSLYCVQVRADKESGMGDDSFIILAYDFGDALEIAKMTYPVHGSFEGMETIVITQLHSSIIVRVDDA